MIDIDFQEKGNIKLHVRKFLLYPPFWSDTNNHIHIKLHWKEIRFSSVNKNSIPEKRGIYCFVVKPKLPSFLETKYLFYVGKTNRTLRLRFKEYLKKQSGKGKTRVKVSEMLELYKDYLYFYFAEINSGKDVDTCEEKLINTYLPHINVEIPIAKLKPELKYIYE